MPMTVSSTKLRSWLQLLRAPNLFTVPGDAWAGMALAAALGGGQPEPGRLVAAGTTVLLLYVFGLVLNDLHDLERDRVVRPERPLPRQAVSRASAVTVLALSPCLALGIASALGIGALLAAGVLMALVWAYDVHAKRSTRLGPPVMGLCRGASLLFGAAVGGGVLPVIAPALGLTVYIALLTATARHEDARHAFGRPVRALPVLFLLTGVAAWVFRFRDAPVIHQTVAGVLLVTATVLVWQRVTPLVRGATEPEVTRAAIGTLIRALIPLQATLLLLSGTLAGTLLAALLVLLFWPCAARLGRAVAGS